jgi:hypothetical protein
METKTKAVELLPEVPSCIVKLVSSIKLDKDPVYKE